MRQLYAGGYESQVARQLALRLSLTQKRIRRWQSFGGISGASTRGAVRSDALYHLPLSATLCFPELTGMEKSQIEDKTLFPQSVDIARFIGYNYCVSDDRAV